MVKLQSIEEPGSLTATKIIQYISEFSHLMALNPWKALPVSEIPRGIVASVWIRHPIMEIKEILQLVEKQMLVWKLACATDKAGEVFHRNREGL